MANSCVQVASFYKELNTLTISQLIKINFTLTRAFIAESTTISQLFVV